MDSTPPGNGYLPPSSVQIKTAKTQKHLYCLVFTSNDNPNYIIQVGNVFGFIISIENIF